MRFIDFILIVNSRGFIFFIIFYFYIYVVIYVVVYVVIYIYIYIYTYNINLVHLYIQLH